MKTYIRIFGLLVIFFLAYKCSLKEEINCGLRDTIDHRHDLIDSLYNQLDSLYHVVDTLQGLYDHRDFPDWDPDDINITSSEMISAMIQVESEGNDSAYCASENAAGCLQIRPIMLQEVNRILKLQGKPKRYTLNDRWNREKSIKMFWVWKNFHHQNSSNEKIARNWNGGPRGINKEATAHYWKKVKNIIDV